MKLRFTINETTYSLPILREGFSLNKRVGNGGRHASASSTIMLQSCDETNLILVHDGNLDAQIIEDDGTIIQTGIIRPYLSAGYRGTFREHVSLELIDYTEKLKEYVWPEPENEADKKEGRIYPESWLATRLSTACTWIFGQCGVSHDLTGLQDRDLPYFSITEGQSLDSVLEELLFCYGMDYTFDAEGKAYIISTFAPETISGNIVDIRGDVSLDRSDDTSDGVEVTYGVASQTNTTIHSADSTNAFKTWWPFAHIMGQEYLHGYWYNGLMHDRIFDDYGKNPPTGRTIPAWDFSKILGLDGSPIPSSDVYKIENITVKSWVSGEAKWTNDMKTTNHLVEYDLNGATFYLEYAGMFDEWFGKGWGFHTRIKADVTYRLKSTASYSVEGPNPDKVDLKYCLLVPDQDTFAQTFAENYYKRQRNGKISVSFRSLVRYEVGGYYNMAGRFPGVAGLSMAVRVTSVSMDADGIYDIEAECCSGMSITETVQKKSYGENAPEVPFNGIATGGYDEEGTNESDETGAYISPDGEAKFNKIIIEGDGSDFQSDVFGTSRPLGDISLANINVPAGGYVSDSVASQLLSLPLYAPMQIMGGRVSLAGVDIPVGAYFMVGKVGERVALYGRDTPVISSGNTLAAAYFDADTGISLSSISGQFSLSDVVLSSRMPGIMVKDVMPYNDGLAHLIGTEALKFEVHSSALYFDQLFGPGRNQLTSFIKGWGLSHGTTPGYNATGGITIGRPDGSDKTLRVEWGYERLYPSGSVISIPEMKDTDYLVFLSYNGGTAREKVPSVYDKTTTGFKVVHSAGLNDGFGLYYMVIGVLA